MKKVKYIPQFMQTECGLCCVAMIANYYDHHISLNQLRDFQQPGRDGVTAKHICRILDQISFDYKLYKCGLSGLEKLPLPLIAFWERAHFIVVEKITRKSVTVVDPALGRITYPRQEFEAGFGRIVICPHPKEGIRKQPREKSIWWQYLPLLFSDKGVIAGVTAFSVLSYFTSICIPTIVERGLEASGPSLTSLLLLSFLVAFGYTFSTLMSSILGALMRTGVYQRFFQTVFDHLTRLEYSFFENRATGGLTFSLDCIRTLNEFYTGRMVNAVVACGAVVVLSVYFALRSIPVFLLLITMSILLTVLLYAANSRVVQLSQVELNSHSKLSIMQLEFISSIESVKIGRLEDYFGQSWSSAFAKNIQKTRRRSVAQAVYSTISSSLTVVLPLIVLFFGLYLASQGHLHYSQAISLYSVAALFVSYAVELVTVANDLEISKNYMDRIKDILAQPQEKFGSEVLEKSSDIAVENLSFRYNRHAPLILDDISMKFQQGKKIAIVGGSGSGKSTLAKLLVRLYMPTCGQVLYGETPVSQVDPASIRDYISMVPQDGTLFNRSIRENLTLFCKECTDEEIVEACQAMQIYEDIMAMPMKFETLISDIGINVSGGQKQRLILARALLANTPFLVLDEATSALDAITEQKIFDALRERGVTQIIIAHRLSTIVDADYIYVLNEGKVVEEGTHETLMAENGIYNKLYQSSQRQAVM